MLASVLDEKSGDGPSADDDNDDDEDDGLSDSRVRQPEVYRVLFGVTTMRERECAKRDRESIERRADDYAYASRVTSQTLQNAYPRARVVSTGRGPRPGLGTRQAPQTFVHTAQNVPWSVVCHALRVRTLGRRFPIRKKDFVDWRVEDGTGVQGVSVPACTLFLSGRTYCVSGFAWQATAYINKQLQGTGDEGTVVYFAYERAPDFAEAVHDFEQGGVDEVRNDYAWMGRECQAIVQRATDNASVGVSFDAGFCAMDSLLWIAVLCEYQRSELFVDSQGSDVVRVAFAPTDRVRGIGPGMPVRATLDPGGTGCVAALVRACVLFQDFECLCETGGGATTQKAAVSVDATLCIRTHTGPNQVTGITEGRRDVPPFRLRLGPLPANEMRVLKPGTVLVTLVQPEMSLEQQQSAT
jgi:hypothetical protein